MIEYQWTEWTPWYGDDCPYPADTLIQVQYNTSTTTDVEGRDPVRAGSIPSEEWQHTNSSPTHVIRHRAVLYATDCRTVAPRDPLCPWYVAVVYRMLPDGSPDVAIEPQAVWKHV